jgi:hypothetical protein
MRRAALVVVLLLARGAAAEPPLVEHQPSPCTVPGQPISLCATVTSASAQVSKVRLYFRAEGAKYWSVAEMTFNGINFCGTLPPPREGKVRIVEYYVQAVDDQYESQRTSTFQLALQSPDQCGFPPLEKDPARIARITVFATNAKQGKKLDDEFDPTGVSFVPVGTR